MKQVLQSYRSGELWLCEVGAPACKGGSVLVRTRRSLVSAGTEKMVVELARKSLVGKAKARPDLVKQVIRKMKTDGVGPTLEKVFAKLDEPIALGYSAAGVVEEIGRDVNPSGGGFEVGGRVAVAGAGYATHAEFNVVPRNLCAAIPGGVSDEDAAFTTVGAIALQGVRQADPKLGERVVVIGLGLIGLLTVQILKANGCAVLGVDLDPRKCELAKELGADAAATAGDEAMAACAAFTQGRGADAVIVTAATASSGPVEQAAELCRMKGRVVVVGMVGMDLPREPFYKKELDLRLSMSYGPGRYDAGYEEGGQDYPFAYVRFTEQRNMESFLYLVAQGKVTPSRLVTHRFAFDDALDAYALLEGKLPEGHPSGAQNKPYLGIVLEYQADAALARRVKLKAAPVAGVATGSGGGPLGIGFIGAGGFAKGVLLPRLSKQVASGAVRLTGVCTTTGMTGQQVGEKHGFAFATTDLDDLLNDDATQAVFVATPHGSHAALACAALRAGKHVFVEKPLGLTEDDLAAYEDALAAARATSSEPSGGGGPCLTVGYNRRSSPHAKLLTDTFNARTTFRGPMVVSYRVNAGRIPPEHWIQDPNVGGGRILGEGCHFVDFCSHLIGSEPVSVVARSIASSNGDVVAHDSVVITLSYADGSLATIQYLAEGHRDLPKERCEVFADGKIAVLDDFRETRIFGAPGKLRGKQAKGFDEELAAFVRVCRDGGDWPIPWASLVATHRACLAALRSLETGRVVELEPGAPPASDAPGGIPAGPASTLDGSTGGGDSQAAATSGRAATGDDA